MKRQLSMTAFGRGESSDGTRSWTAEIRSVNHRFCDISIRIPKEYTGLEDRIRKVINSFYSRGRIEVNLAMKGEDPSATLVVPNIQYARQYYESLVAISRELGLNEKPDLAIIAENKDIISHEDITEDLDKIWPAIQSALHKALEQGQEMRANEGKALKEDLQGRLDFFSEKMDFIENSIPSIVAARHEALNERIRKFLDESSMDPIRLAQEAAILADKADITEEIVRLRSHIEQFRVFLSLDEPVGRRLDFLLQEFLREINTVASKIADASMAHQTVDMKNEVEKLREQVQNLE